MKTSKYIYIAISLISGLTACKKSDNHDPQAAGAINVTNAVIGGSGILLTTNYNIVTGGNTVGSNASAFMPLVGGQVQVYLSVPAVTATATTPAVPAVPYYTNALTIDNGTNYSLFLTGASPSAIDNVLIKETYPATYADSVCAVRFINLATGSNPVSVNIKGAANGSESASLAYKAYSDFKKHPAKMINTSYVFEFRDQATGTLLTSYTLTTPAFHNVTLALRGKTGAYGVILNNDY